MKQDLVLTPGGYRARHLVRRLSADDAVVMEEGRSLIKNRVTGAIVETDDAATLPGDIPAFASGWIGYACWTNDSGSPIKLLETTWLVPPVPKTQSGQTVFLFNGMDPVNPSIAILQPVLQWGVSAAGGGPYWAIASWYVLGDGHAYHSELVPVNPGEELTGVLELSQHANLGYDYTCEFRGRDTTRLSIEKAPELVWLNETLEAYEISRCSDYPDVASTDMSRIKVATESGSPRVNWIAQGKVTDCGERVVVKRSSPTDGEILIYYRDAKLQGIVEEARGEPCAGEVTKRLFSDVIDCLSEVKQPRTGPGYMRLMFPVGVNSIRLKVSMKGVDVSLDVSGDGPSRHHEAGADQDTFSTPARAHAEPGSQSLVPTASHTHQSRARKPG